MPTRIPSSQLVSSVLQGKENGLRVEGAGGELNVSFLRSGEWTQTKGSSPQTAEEEPGVIQITLDEAPAAAARPGDSLAVETQEFLKQLPALVGIVARARARRLIHSFRLEIGTSVLCEIVTAGQPIPRELWEPEQPDGFLE